MEKIYTALQNKKKDVLLLFIIFILPPIGIYAYSMFFPVITAINLIMLTICCLACFLIMFFGGWNWHSWDLEVKKFTYLAYLVFTLSGIVFLYTAKEILGLKLNEDLIYNTTFKSLIGPICLLQVFSYNFFLLRKLEEILDINGEKDVQSFWTLVILTTIFFTEMHIMFSLKFIAICFIGGFFFNIMYIKFRNWILMFISHLTLNFFAAYFGFFPA